MCTLSYASLITESDGSLLMGNVTFVPGLIVLHGKFSIVENFRSNFREAREVKAQVECVL